MCSIDSFSGINTKSLFFSSSFRTKLTSTQNATLKQVTDTLSILRLWPVKIFTGLPGVQGVTVKSPGVIDETGTTQKGQGTRKNSCGDGSGGVGEGGDKGREIGRDGGGVEGGEGVRQGEREEEREARREVGQGEGEGSAQCSTSNKARASRSVIVSSAAVSTESNQKHTEIAGEGYLLFCMIVRSPLHITKYSASVLKRTVSSCSRHDFIMFRNLMTSSYIY